MLFTHGFSEKEIQEYVNQTAAYMRAQREIYYPQGSPLPEDRIAEFKPFFPEPILKYTKFFHKTDGPLEEPDFLKELTDKGIPFTFGNLQAITFVDVVVSYEPLPAKVQFHELVHAVQYQKLGLKQFANKYVRGFMNTRQYLKVPLESSARLLAEAWEKEPAKAFSVEQDVQRWINENKF